MVNTAEIVKGVHRLLHPALRNYVKHEEASSVYTHKIVDGEGAPRITR